MYYREGAKISQGGQNIVTIYWPQGQNTERYIGLKASI